MGLTEPRPAPVLTVVVLAYNEAENLRAAVADLLAQLRKTPRPFELILVDDGSSDGTGALADEIARAEREVRVVHHGTNRGLGGGYRTGFVEAAGELVIFFPADGQYPPALIEQYEPRMKDRDMVLGYLDQRTDSLAGTALSLAERAVYRVLFGPMPRFQGLLMFRRALLDGLPLTSTGRGWGVLMEFILRTQRAGHRIESIPIQVLPRQSGQSKVRNLRTIASNLWQLWGLKKAIDRSPSPPRA
jgi:dolichol-phosphate mannosyltransferase